MGPTTSTAARINNFGKGTYEPGTPLFFWGGLVPYTTKGPTLFLCECNTLFKAREEMTA